MTKEQLRNFQSLKREHRRLEQRLRVLERRPESEEATLRPLREFYKAKLDELTKAQLEIERAIETLTPTERDLIRLRYLDERPWHRVASEIHYSEAQARRLHEDILEKLKKL